MNSIIISCTPRECEQIANGDLTVLVRKIAPKEVPFKAYVYCAKHKYFQLVKNPNNCYEAVDEREYFQELYGKYKFANTFNGKVIGEFICDYVIDGASGVQEWISIRENCGLCGKDLYEYCGEDKDGETKYCKGLHLTEAKIYDEPRELSEFRKPMLPTGLRWENDKITRPPATYCYVEED